MKKGFAAIVVCGGKSTRMGTDKSLLTYYDQPQRYHLYQMLKPLCDAVFISCNKNQAHNISEDFEVIKDHPAFENIGPMACILTAFEYYPDKNFLLIGCDYPLLTSAEIENFLNLLPDESVCGAFYNSDNKYEPLLAYYSKECAQALKECFERKEYSLQHFLRSQNAWKYIPTDKEIMKSADTVEEYQQIKLHLKNIALQTS